MKIQSYIGRNSIISSAYPPINIKTEEKKIKNNWENRMVVCDIEKRMLDILSQKKSQWLLVDLIDERFGLLEVKVGKLTSYVTYSQVLKRSEYIKQIAEKGNYEVIDQDEIDEYTVQSIFSRFCKEILSLYDANHIIINKTYPVKYYISHDGKIKAFDNEVSIEKYRRRLERYYHMLEKNWNGCHVIEMPSNTIGDENHKWGLASTHFTQDYYENLLQEIRKIVYS